jgi:hypothetical protein
MIDVTLFINSDYMISVMLIKETLIKQISAAFFGDVSLRSSDKTYAEKYIAWQLSKASQLVCYANQKGW